MSFLLSEGLSYHIDKSLPIRESVYRPGSEMFFHFISEAKRCYRQGLFEVDACDHDLLMSDIGEYGLWEGNVVPLDYPIPVELDTLNESDEPVSSTRNAKFRSSSFSNRSLICLDVTYLPSLPKKGESFIVNNIDIVGSSMLIVGNDSGAVISATVSPISKPSKPTNAQSSPAETSSTFAFPKPSKTYSSFSLLFLIVPSLEINETCCPCSNFPLCNLPIAIRPIKEE